MNAMGNGMLGKIALRSSAALVCLGLCLSEPALAKDDVAGVESTSLLAGGDRNKRYFLIGADSRARAPKKGSGLVVVLPGGDGGPRFNPFVKRIYKHALPKTYLVAQLVSVKWTPAQRIVWPTAKVRVDKQKFSTEQFVNAVIKDIQAKWRLNKDRIFTLSWSSGGPAAYAISLREQTSVTGSYVAMSVFKPKALGPLKHAAGQAYFIDHSPTDRVCPFSMAKKARTTLAAHGAKAKLVTYKGGHGWRGNVYGRIGKGIQWLESVARARPDKKPPSQTQPSATQPARSSPAKDVPSGPDA